MGKLKLVFSYRAYELVQKNLKEGEIYSFGGKYKKVNEDTNSCLQTQRYVSTGVTVCTIPLVCDIHLADI